MTVTNVMSIDVEEWYDPEALRPHLPRATWVEQVSRVEEQVIPLLDLLAEREARATFFVLGRVARRNPSVLRRIVDAGHEVASHGDSHQMITEMTPETFRRDLSEAKKALEDATGRPVRGYRAPTFSVVERTLWALDIILETGHDYDASVYPIHHDRYGIPSAPRFAYRHGNGLVELPGSTIRLFGTNVPVGGGGYLRLLPLAFNLAALTRINRVEGRPFVVYLHPWETDPDQPRVALPFPRSLRHYANIGTMKRKLDTLLQRFRFTTAEDLLIAEGLLSPRPAGQP